MRRLRGFALPVWLFGRLAAEIVQGCRRRAAVEEIHELRRHPLPIRLTLLAAFCHLRTGELIDTLSDLLIDMIHRVAHRAETKVQRCASPKCYPLGMRLLLTVKTRGFADS